jgi:hypothetical protein
MRYCEIRRKECAKGTNLENQREGRLVISQQMFCVSKIEMVAKKGGWIEASFFVL